MNFVKTNLTLLSFIAIAFLYPRLSFAHNIVVEEHAEHGAARANSVVILQAADPGPYNAVLLNQVELGGKSVAESYRELLASARLMAMKSGANVIKITERNRRSADNPGERLKVALYKSENPRALETAFSWTPDRKLTWADFRGPAQAAQGADIAAATFCGIGFETSTVSETNPKLKVYVFNTFYPAKSWVRADQRKAQILAHEQCHFDICELYTRKLRARMSNIDVPVTALNTTLRNIYNEVKQEYIIRQERYEQETEHGIIPEEQARWEKIIAAELKATAKWME